MNGVVIRTEEPGDYAVVEQLVTDAFDSPEHGELVRLLRQTPGFDTNYSLVAIEGDTIVGHVMMSYVDLVGETTHRVLSLSPLAVLPAAQRRGIGGALVNAVVERAEERAEPLIVLEGSPAYYPRFGFRYAGPYGITMDLPSWAPKEAAMVRPLTAYRPDLRGKVVYPPAMDVVPAE